MSALSSPSISPNASINFPKRRLSARRGSQAAHDPFNAHAELNHHIGRSTSSRLTIVRVVPDAPVEDHSVSSSPIGRRHSLQHHRRTGSGPGDSPRLSFANASFTRPGASGGGSGSASSSRPSSPTLNRPRSPGPSSNRHSLPARVRFTPDDIVRLAREATNPQYNPSVAASATSSKPSSVSNSPLASPVVGTAPTSLTPVPTSFTALPDDIWLPFVDRPAEVSTLITSHPTARLFALLAQTLPSTDSATFTPPRADDDSSQWSYAQLDHWLRHVDREEADDHLWVRRARACVLAHSELIWERIKGALGVPPELDTDQPPPPAPEPLHMGDENAFESDPEDAATAAALFDEFDEPEVAIEHVVVPTTPPMSAVAGDPSSGGLGDIGEEDEEETNEETQASAPIALAPPREEIVQGLRISTSPQPPPAASPICYPMSPSTTIPHSPSIPLTARAGGPSPADSMFHLDAQTTTASSSATPTAEAGPTIMIGTPSRRERSYSSSSWGSSKSGYYDVVGERGPGNPLFPSSFARLALAPTLSANNPALRSPNPPPVSAYGMMRTGSSGMSPAAVAGPSVPRKLPSWAAGFDPSRNEYAVTTASGSSLPGDLDR